MFYFPSVDWPSVGAYLLLRRAALVYALLVAVVMERLPVVLIPEQSLVTYAGMWPTTFAGVMRPAFSHMTHSGWLKKAPALPSYRAICYSPKPTGGTTYGRQQVQRGVPDSKTINTSEKWEVEYWKKKFGVSGQALAGAVRAVGKSAQKVEKYLKEK